MTLYDLCIGSQLATAPTNGCIILWDITKNTKSKLGKGESIEHNLHEVRMGLLICLPFT